MKTKIIGILTTHPIQYQVPWFRELSKKEEIDLTVFYCMIPDAFQQGEGFGLKFHWDIPLLYAYKYEILKNIAHEPSVSLFRGCDTPGIHEIVKGSKFDVFIVNGWFVKSCVQLLYYCRRYKIPCIVRGESNSLRKRAWWKRIIHHWLLNKYSAFLNIGKSNKDFYLKNGVPKEKLFFTPYCIENERFSTSAKELRPQKNNIRNKWEINLSAVTFLFCAKFIEKKRPIDLLKAFNIACKKMRRPEEQVHLLMVGDGKLKSQCENFVKNNNLSVTFTGFLNQSKIVRGYVASDCLVLPSDYSETWGLVVNEAMACGIPAIVSNRVGCHPDLIISGKTGEVFPFGDIDSLSELLLFYIQNPDYLKCMGFEAQQHIKQYSYGEVVKGTLEALDYVCNKYH